MRTPGSLTVALLVSLGVMVAAGCGKPPVIPAPTPAPPPPASITIVAPPEAKITAAMTITASPEANPDRTGRPSPIVVRVYQLKTDAAFSAAAFSDLFDNEEKVLGAELISRDEFVLAPKDSRTISVAISEETRFLGAIAGFRDILNAEWRVLIPTPRKGLTVAVERARLMMSALN
jgi:type VI secretion system protein VasD